MSVFPILLIGAQKSGSSYLFRLIEQHPLIARSKVKGPKILSKPMYDDSDFFSHFEVQPNHRFVLDGSDSYLHVEGTAAIAEVRLGSDIPILAVIRDPVERTVSGYLHEVKHGREMRMAGEVFDLPHDLDAAVSAEGDAIHTAWKEGAVQPHLPPTKRYRDQFFAFRYVKNSRYVSELQQWESRFPNLRLVEFSQLRTDPAGVARTVFKWLGLPEISPIKTDFPSNPTKLRPWVAFRENLALTYDYERPNLLALGLRQLALFSRIRNEKPRIPDGLSDALHLEFDMIRGYDRAKWLL
jgi:hypothetical protein